ncbi:MAG: hypothetical protein DBY43_03630 [Clostridiaceae bacterium]|nr:MAG: hypothetical protein DBY43_03630 [Clostridiaceae bacterium]
MESKKKNNVLIIVIIVLLAIGVGVLGFIYGKKSITPKAKFVKVMSNYLEKNNIEDLEELFDGGYSVNTTNDFKISADNEEVISGKLNINNIHKDNEQYTEISLGDGSDFLKGNIYLKDNKAYVKLNDVFDKYYYMNMESDSTDYVDAFKELKKSIVKVVNEYFTDDKFTLTKDSNNDKISISLTGKDGATLVLKFYEEIKNNDKILGLFTDDDTSLDEVKSGLKEDIDNLKEEMDSYSDEVVISYDIYLNKNKLVKQELTIEDMVLTITGEDSGDITLISAGTTIISGTYSKDNLNLKISTDMINAELSIERQNIKEDKISGDYKTTIKLTSGGSTIDVTINTNVKYDKSASIPNIDLSTAKSFDEITDNELEEIYSKLYPILEPIMGNIDNEEIETTY